MNDNLQEQLARQVAFQNNACRVSLWCGIIGVLIAAMPIGFVILAAVTGAFR